MAEHQYRYMRIVSDIEDTELKKDDIVMVTRETDYDNYVIYTDYRNDLHGRWISKEFLKPLIQ